MSFSASHEESAPAEPSPTVIGLEGWPHLEFHYVLGSEVTGRGWRVEVVMTFAPPPLPSKAAENSSEPGDSATADVTPSDDPRTALREHYRAIGAQWETEHEVTLEATFCVGSLLPAGSESPATCLRKNAHAIVAALEADGATGEVVAPELVPLAFALPDPVASPANYAGKVLQPLAVALHFRPATDGQSPVTPASVTPVPPQPDLGADAMAPSYRTLATAVETAFANLGWRIVEAEENSAGERELAVLRWQVKDGLQFTLSEPDAAGRAGFACPPLTTVVPSRADISGARLPPGFPARYAGAAQLTVVDFDVDVALAGFLDEVEAFLAPERRARMAFFESALVKRGLAAKEALADLLAARVAAISANATGPAARDAAQAVLRAAFRADLRNFHRIGAVGLWQLDIAAPLPFVVHGRFVPDGVVRADVLGGSVRVATKANPLALAVCAGAEDGADGVELPGSFCCEAIAPVDETDGREGAKLHFVTDAATLVPAPPLRARLPWRVLPVPPWVVAQVGLADEAATVEAAKTWRLRCDYVCDPARGDALRWSTKFGPPPMAAPAREERRLDLLDTLVVFRAKLPAITEELDRSLPSLVRATTVRADAPVRDAIRAFVLLAEWVAENFVVPQEFQEPVDILPLGGDVVPRARGDVTVGPFDIARDQSAQVGLQIVRNADAGLAPVFRYATRAVWPPEEFSMFIDRELPIDLTTLPPLDGFLPSDPPPGSLTDSVGRLLEAVVSAPGPKAGAPIVALKLVVEFARHVAGPAVGGMETRLPVTLATLPAFSPERRPDEVRQQAQLLGTQLEAWLDNQEPQARGAAQAGTRFVFDVTLQMFDAPEARPRPVLRLRELYIPCAPG